ncbi:MAG: type II secretion system F family protein [Verrucomicrobiota bacterium]
MNESLVTYGIWFIPVLYMLCFGMLAYALIGGLHEAADSYQSVYAEQASRELEDLFMFIPAKRIADLARVAAVTMFLTIFMVGGDFASPGGMFRGVFLGVLAASLILLAPAHLITLLRKRRLERFNVQLTGALTGMSNALRAGFSIQQSFESVVQEGQNPISQEFGVFLQQCRVGVNFDDAMQNLEERVGSEDMTLMVRAIEIARQTGGNLTEVFDQIASTIRERTRVEGRIRALTAMGRLQGLVVGLIPVFLLFVMTLLDPTMMMNFYTSVVGISMLVLVVVIEIVGFLVIRKIVNIDV